MLVEIKINKKGNKHGDENKFGGIDYSGSRPGLS